MEVALSDAEAEYQTVLQGFAFLQGMTFRKDVTCISEFQTREKVWEKCEEMVFSDVKVEFQRVRVIPHLRPAVKENGHTHTEKIIIIIKKSRHSQKELMKISEFKVRKNDHNLLGYRK